MIKIIVRPGFEEEKWKLGRGQPLKTDPTNSVRTTGYVRRSNLGDRRWVVVDGSVED